MASEVGSVNVRIVLDNPKAKKALDQALELADELVSDMPWSEDAKALRKRLNYLANNLALITVESD